MRIEFYKGSRRFEKAKTCPCGKSNRDGKFVPFVIDNIISEKDGFCHACGKTFLPNGIQKRKAYSINNKEQLSKYVSNEDMDKTFNHFQRNNFFVWLNSVFTTDTIEMLQRKYFVGTANRNATLFWYSDIHGKIMNAKKILYKINGHRDKSHSPYFIFKKENGYSSCLFGEHLLKSVTSISIIVLVESEKSAIIGSAYYPNYIWLATGGANGLTEQKAKVLSKRTVLYMPDCDEAGRNSVAKVLNLLEKVNCHAKYVDLFPELWNGEDIVDLIIT
jgi:hypothetical protein